MVESKYSQGRQMPVPIGLDHLNFKNDPVIMSQLDANGNLAF